MPRTINIALTEQEYIHLFQHYLLGHMIYGEAYEEIRKKGACGQKKRIDLYSGGQEMPGRKWQASDYRYNYNGKETDKEVFEGFQNYGFRMYDSRLGRFLSVDPLAKHYAYKTPYDFAENDVIRAIDLDGAEKRIVVKVRDGAGKIIAMRVGSSIANQQLQDQIVSTYNSGTGTWSQVLVDNNNNTYNDQEVVVFDYDVNGNLTITFKENLDEFEEIVKNGKYKGGADETNFTTRKEISHPDVPKEKFNVYYTGYLHSQISSTYRYDLVTHGPKKEGVFKNGIYGDKSSAVWQTTNTTLRDVFNNNFKVTRINTTNSLNSNNFSLQDMTKVLKTVGNALNKVGSWFSGLFHKEKATPPPKSVPSY